MNPKHPVYIVSKGRADTRLTAKALESMGVPYWIVVEPAEVEEYRAVIDPSRVLELDMAYKDNYDTCDEPDPSKGKGPGAARNFVWDHAIASGATWHWVMDDNIRRFLRLQNNQQIPVADGTIFRCMEDWAERFTNMAMVGPNYYMFVPRKVKVAPLTLNTRIYSCNLIRNDIPYRWRGRYNEDTDLSLRILKDGWCTAQFYAFLQLKTPTQRMKGGNTAEFYGDEGTLHKSQMIKDLHPDVAEVVWKFSRWHHEVDYSRFMRENKPELRPGLVLPPGPNEYGMVEEHKVGGVWVEATRPDIRPSKQYVVGHGSEEVAGVFSEEVPW